MNYGRCGVSVVWEVGTGEGDEENVPLDAEYPNVACSPKVPTPRPAIEAVTMTREGSSRVAFFWRRGANLPLTDTSVITTIIHIPRTNCASNLADEEEHTILSY